MHEYLIVANGVFESAETIQTLAINKTIIALDSAATKLKNIGITPGIIFGDLDFENASEKDQWELTNQHQALLNEVGYFRTQENILIVLAVNQNQTDLYKAIAYCDQEGAKSITLTCCLGARTDHHEANLRALRVFHRPERSLIIFSEMEKIEFVKNKSIDLPGKVGDRVAVLAFPAATCTSKGLQYEMQDYALEFGFSESVSNALATPIAQLIIHGEALVISERCRK